jgi:lactoylglutathione lyase
MATTLEMGHIGLSVSDLGRSTRFYQDLLGFELQGESTEEGRAFVLLGRGSELLLTLWQQASSRHAPGPAGLHHLSFQAAHMDEVRAAEAKLEALGIDFKYAGVVPHVDGSASGGIFFHDPDGIRLELFAPKGAEGKPAPVPGAPSCGFF